MPSLAALVLTTALLSSPEHGWTLELEVPLAPTPRALTALAERVHTVEGWFGIAVHDELALLVDVRLDGPASHRAFSASLGIALTR